jgi:3-hydroxyisobutyrate dehydrogenase-like beta-hydroxyacid dehydrogenase
MNEIRAVGIIGLGKMGMPMARLCASAASPFPVAM